MAVKPQKWGNSVGVQLPKPMLEQIGLKEGAQVGVLVEGNLLGRQILILEPTPR